MKARRITRFLTGMGAMVLGFSGVIFFHASESAAQTIREIAVPGMRGIASAGYRGKQLTIEYNPRTCSRLGPELCSFFRAHEYGHIAMNHLGRKTPVRRAEYEADVWASQNTTPAARDAAIRYFNSGKGGSFLHGSGKARASRVASVGAKPAPTRVAKLRDGTKTVNRYSAVISRPFTTQTARLRPVTTRTTKPRTAKQRVATTQTKPRVATTRTAKPRVVTARTAKPKTVIARTVIPRISTTQTVRPKVFRVISPLRQGQ